MIKILRSPLLEVYCIYSDFREIQMKKVGNYKYFAVSILFSGFQAKLAPKPHRDITDRVDKP